MSMDKPLPQPDRTSLFLQLAPLMAERARTAAERARSYRGFKVGATALAIANNSRFFKILSGSNFKPQPDGLKVCAERAALREALAGGHGRVLGLVVSGPAQTDHISGRDSHTLHPCGECRERFRESPLVQNDTLIMSMAESHKAYELYSIGELLAWHDGQQPEEVETPSSYHFEDPGFRAWLASRAIYAASISRLENSNLVQLATNAVMARQALRSAQASYTA